MFNLRKFFIVIPALLFILACQTVTRPIEKVQDAGATAASLATQAGEVRTQVSGLATEIVPIQTFMPELPSGNPLDPQSPPLSEWNEIPIMPQASAGEESEGVYFYKVTATAKEVEEYYATQLSSLGWKTEFSVPATSGIAILMYSKGDQILSITVTDQQDFILVMLTLQ